VGGVDRTLLYGSTPGGAHRIIIPRGNPPTALPALPFAARAIFAENPSGVWYQVNGFTVPPWTWGLVNRLDAAASSVVVSRLTTPEVQISEDYGGDMTVIAYEEALLPSLGRSLYPVPHDVLHAETNLNALEGGSFATVIASVTGRRIVVLRAYVVVRPEKPIRGLTYGSFVAGQSQFDPQFADWAVSPEAPQSPPLDMERALDEGTRVSALASTAPNIGAVGLEAVVDYYLALP
jgi:hypothetical protein